MRPFERTRSGYGPASLAQPRPYTPPPITIAYYAPKPAWMTHVPGPWLRFTGRHAFEQFLKGKSRVT